MTGFVHLNPTNTYNERIAIGIPSGSDNTTPGSATFSIVFTATAGT